MGNGWVVCCVKQIVGYWDSDEGKRCSVESNLNRMLRINYDTICSTLLYSTTSYHAVLNYTISSHPILYFTTLHNSTVQYSTV